MEGQIEGMVRKELLKKKKGEMGQTGGIGSSVEKGITCRWIEREEKQLRGKIEDSARSKSLL